MMKNARIRLNVINIVSIILTIVIISIGGKIIRVMENSIVKLEQEDNDMRAEQTREYIQYAISIFVDGISEDYNIEHGDIIMDHEAVPIRSNPSNENNIIIIDNTFSNNIMGYLDTTASDMKMESILSLATMRGLTGDNSKLCSSSEWVSNIPYPIAGQGSGNYEAIYGESNDDYEKCILVLGIDSSGVYTNQNSRDIEDHKSIIDLVYFIMIVSCLSRILLMCVLLYRHVPSA